MTPDIIVGAGPSGLMVGNRLKALNRPFLILERGDVPMARTGDGFFYLHEQIMGTETPIKVTVTSCPGADERVYAQKVYGDPGVSPVSIKTQSGSHVGYQLDAESLLAPVREFIQTKIDISYIDVENRIVFARDGHSWPYERLHSTIPLPMLAGMMPRQPSVIFRSKPIWIESSPLSRASAEFMPVPGEMRSHYCPGDCHNWYRLTIRGQKAQYERMENMVYGAFPIKPGKIWLDPANREKDEEELIHYRFYLSDHQIFLWGRYAEWKPKQLLHNVWNNLKLKLH
jgi:hypothetical protein